MDVVETLNCSSCRATFSDVDQLVEHSARPCVTADLDRGRCSSDASDVDDHVVGAVPSSGAPVAGDDVTGVESTARTGQLDDADHDVDGELDSAADDSVQPQLPPSSMQHFPFFDADNDDSHLNASDDYILPSISCSRGDGHFDKVYGLEADASAAGPRPFPDVDGHMVADGGRSSATVKASSVSQLIDNNVSPASKIAMLESVVYALHRQQMFQLELIEALRRQLATALAASSSRPGDDSGGTTLDLTVPRASSETSVLDQRSSLSSLMRLSAGVDARRAPSAAGHSPSTSPTALSASTSDGHDAAAATSWAAELTSNKSRAVTASLPSVQKHGPAQLSDLSLFKKGELSL